MEGHPRDQQSFERQRGDACAPLPAGYRRREPEKSVLYQAIQENVATFLAEMRRNENRGLPAYVEREFDRYLGCGVLSEGFARVRCEGCGHDFLVAFSCKNRGICPSCTARRAQEVAAHLVDHVLPRVPIRQWVLSFPRRIRWHLGNDPDLMASALQVFLRALFNFQSRRARRQSEARRSQTGSVTFIQRFGSALQFNVHFHVLMPDGVFVANAGPSEVQFLELPPPSDEEVAQLLSRVVRRVIRLLQRRGRLEEDAVPEDMLGWLKVASVQMRLPMWKGGPVGLSRANGDVRPKMDSRFTPMCAFMGTTAAGLSSCACTQRGDLSAWSGWNDARMGCWPTECAARRRTGRRICSLPLWKC
jgi:hypothetical protein